MFAGPNGSGKSIIKHAVPPQLLGIYVNPDDIEKQMRDTGGVLNFDDFGINTSKEEFETYLSDANRANKRDLIINYAGLKWNQNKVSLNQSGLNSYAGSVLAEFIRAKLMTNSISFSTETVMSHKSKVELLRDAQAAGYRTYLYYIATDDPEINCFRVKQRVLKGGHSVAENKIRERYQRSLDLVRDAIRFSNRAYFFDNSFGERQIDDMWVAEVTEGKSLLLKQESIPQWFVTSVWNKLDKSSRIQD
ncbi:MAG: zeta toxin family protein [bacterium]